MENKKIKLGAMILSSIFGVTMISCSKGSDEVEMGRYIEEYYEVPEEVYSIIDLKLFEDGTIGMLAYGEEYIEYYVSDDNCKSWSKKELNLPQSNSENESLSIDNAILSHNGDIFMSYSFYDYSEFEDYSKDEMVEEVDNSDTAIEGIVDEEYYEPEYQYAYIDSEGNLSNISLDEITENSELEGDEFYYGGYYYTFHFANNGSVIVSNDNGSIYELDPTTGEVKNEFILDDLYINGFTTIGDSLVVIGDESVKEYSLSKGEELGNIEALENEVLYKNNPNFYGINDIFSDDDKTIYYSNTTGLYKYELGDDSVEQIIDGSLCSLGNENIYIDSFIASKDNTFLASGQDYSDYESNVNITKFVYSEDIPKVPENLVTVYSLYDNYQVRQDIALYQKANPDKYVKLEIGLTGEDAVTESDALRTLNTEIMAGKGPDILLLNDMSESYLEEGLLEDISDVIQEYTNKDLLFENIVNAYKDEEGKIYSIPVKFTVPAILGKSEYVNSVTDLNTLTEALVKSAKDSKNAENNEYVEMYTPSMLVAMLYYSNGGTWINEDNTINEDNIKEFLEEAKKVFDAYLETYNKEQYSDFIESMQEYMDETGEDIGAYYMDNYLSPFSMMDESSKKLSVGIINDTDFLNQVYSLNKINSDITYSLTSGKDSNIFVPEKLIGINAKSKNKEDAKDFISYLLSEESQSIESYDGFPINKAAFDKLAEYPYDEIDEENPESNTEEQSYGSWGIVGENGEDIELKIYWVTEEFFNTFKEQIKELETPVVVNKMVLKEVFNAFSKFVNGEGTLDEVVKNISDNIDLILAE